jgi:hypothetical protein
VHIDDLAAELEHLGRAGFQDRYGRHYLVLADRDDVDEISSFVNTQSRDGHSIVTAKSKPNLDVRPIVRKPTSPDRARITVGRGRSCDIELRHPRVSTLHATFSYGGGLLLVNDERSKNGTRVNQAPLQAHKPAPVDVGDSIEFGPVTATLWSIDDLIAAIDR